VIDAKRWVLAEAWLSLGLRVCWGYDGMFPRDQWQDDEGRGRYGYLGGGEWAVLRPYDGRTGPINTAPSLSTETMRHELAHYLSATEEDRGKRNFGLDENGPADNEDAALLAERVVDAILEASSRIIALATERRP
jgi:hypothetical protein